MKTSKAPRALAFALLGAGAAFFLWSRSRSARRIDFFGKTVVIAGGSRGLGLAIARLLVAEGTRLVLLARMADELERARAELVRGGGDVITFPCDVGYANRSRRR